MRLLLPLLVLVAVGCSSGRARLRTTLAPDSRAEVVITNAERLQVRNGARQRLARDEPRRPGAIVEPSAHKLRSTHQLRGLARSSRGATCGAGRRAFAATRRQFCKTADGARVPLQAWRSRARRLRLCAAAGAARTCVARLQPPRPLTRWPSPRRRGPRSPCDDLCGPAECPTSVRSSMPTTTYAQNQHLPLIRWRSG